MEIGHLNQKASSPLSIFVISCCIVITTLLWTMQKAIAKGESFYTDEGEYAIYYEI